MLQLVVRETKLSLSISLKKIALNLSVLIGELCQVLVKLVRYCEKHFGFGRKMLDIRGAISLGESVDVEKTRRNVKGKNLKKEFKNHEEEDENQNLHYR